MSEELPMLKDARHQLFADAVLEGINPSEAYRRAGYSAKSAQSLATCAGRLLKNVEVATYLLAVRRRASLGKVLSLQLKREFLFRVMTTPLCGIDPMGPDGDLIVKYKNTVTEAGGCVEMVKYDALKAIEADNKLSGDDAESNAVGSLAQALAGLGGGGGGGVMEDKM